MRISPAAKLPAETKGPLSPESGASTSRATPRGPQATAGGLGLNPHRHSPAPGGGTLPPQEPGPREPHRRLGRHPTLHSTVGHPPLTIPRTAAALQVAGTRYWRRISSSWGCTFRSSVSVRYIISNWLRSVNKSETTRSWTRTHGREGAGHSGSQTLEPNLHWSLGPTRCGHCQPSSQSRGGTGDWLRNRCFGHDSFCLPTVPGFSRYI